MRVQEERLLGRGEVPVNFRSRGAAQTFSIIENYPDITDTTDASFCTQGRQPRFDSRVTEDTFF